MPLLSVVTTAYNEAENLPVLYQRLAAALDDAGIPWELIAVDDHSRDGTFGALCRLASADTRVRGVRLSRNTGSHTAILCAIENARGDCIAQIACDLQHPPELLPELWEAWRKGAQVVWGNSGRRPEGLARLYYFVMRRLAGIREMPAGADFFAMDRQVARALLDCGERNTSILALIAWMGFRQVSVAYDRLPRLHGRSGWTLAKKFTLAIDSVASFTCLPLRLLACAGILLALLGLVAAAVEDWPSLVAAILVVGGLQLIGMGVLGEYVWRALDEARRRPRYFVEADTAWKSPGNAS